MYGVNKVILIGTVGKDPEMHEFKDGGIKASFTLATSKKGYTNKQGGSVPDKTEWHNIVVTGGLAKVVRQYVKKGTNLYIEGELRTRKYSYKGVENYITEIYADNMHMLPDSKKNSNNIDNAQNDNCNSQEGNQTAFTTINNSDSNIVNSEDNIPSDNDSYISI